MIRSVSALFALLFCWAALAQPDDGLGLRRGADPAGVTLSGVSSGAAMAVQYAVAHSSTVAGVGSIAGPAWGCAGGDVSRAINDCMCARHPVTPQLPLALTLAGNGKREIDPLVHGKAITLKRAYVFQSAADATVKPAAARSGIDFLSAIVHEPVVLDSGSVDDGSNYAGHGIVSPDGTDACRAGPRDRTYVRQCRTADNAGHLFHALYAQGRPYDPGQRVNQVPDEDVWHFDQQHIVAAVKPRAEPIAPDQYFGLWPVRSERRENFDLAKTGYLYVPPACRAAGSRCHVHVALHGCKQDARQFAATAGYNNWANYYRVIVVYPAIAPARPWPEEVCRMPALTPAADVSWVEPNDNGCWDWWGYLDLGGPDQYRYLTKRAPQMQVIERIIAELTRPLP